MPTTRRTRSVASVLAFAATLAAAPPLAIQEQGSFFVGGHDIHSETLTDFPGSPPSGTITVDQMYVRYQIPVHAARHPITFIHGCCLTGKTWETTPDGRMGWDEYFLRKGYPVYVVDQAARGRSAGDLTAVNAVRFGKAPADRLPAVRQESHENAWVVFRFGPEYPKAFPGVQFPLEAQAEFWKQMAPDWNASLPTPNPNFADLSELARRLRGTVLVSHSQSGIYPFQTAAVSTEGIAGIIAIEPSACPSPAGDLKPYLGIPILIVFGDYVEQSTRWGPRLKACRAFAEAVAAAKGNAHLIALPDIGIRGNSHMLMQDKNNLLIADRLIAWLAKNVPR